MVNQLVFIVKATKQRVVILPDCDLYDQLRFTPKNESHRYLRKKPFARYDHREGMRPHELPVGGYLVARDDPKIMFPHQCLISMDPATNSPTGIFAYLNWENDRDKLISDPEVCQALLDKAREGQKLMLPQRLRPPKTVFNERFERFMEEFFTEEEQEDPGWSSVREGDSG